MLIMVACQTHLEKSSPKFGKEKKAEDKNWGIYVYVRSKTMGMDATA